MKEVIKRKNIFIPIYMDKDALYEMINKKYEAANNKNTCVAKTEYQFIEAKKVDTLYIAGVKFSYSSDLWDFSSICSEGKTKSVYKFNFSKVSEENKELIKMYVLYLINQNGPNHSSNKDYFKFANELLLFCEEEGFYIEELLLKDVKFFIENKNYKRENTISNAKNFIRAFLDFYSVTINDISKDNINEYLEEIDTTTANAEKEANKTVLLPTSFYGNLRDIFYKEFKNKNNSKMRRGLSGLCYIDTQIGIRPEELGILQCDDLKIDEYKGKPYALINYRQTKSVRDGYSDYDRNDIAINKKCVEIFKELIDLFDEERTKVGSKLLVINDKGKENNYYVSSRRLNFFLTSICMENAEKLEIINVQDKDSFGRKFSVAKLREGYLCTTSSIDPLLKDDDIISLPSFTQFRVYVESESMKRGDNIRLISQQFGHIAIEDDYYARYKESVQEESNTAKEYADIGFTEDYYEERLKKLKERGGIKIKTDGPLLYMEKGMCGKKNYERICPNLPDKIQTDNIKETCYNLTEAYKYNKEHGFLDEAQHTLNEINSLKESVKEDSSLEQDNRKNSKKAPNQL